MTEYERGFMDGFKAVVALFHERAMEMNDPHAKAVLNSMAFHLGTQRGKICVVKSEPEAA